MSAKKNQKSSIRGSPDEVFSGHLRSKSVGYSEISVRGLLAAIFPKMKFWEYPPKAMAYSFTVENSIF